MTHLQHPLLLLEFLLLLNSLSIDIVQRVDVRDLPSLHVHKVQLVAIRGVLDGAPGLGHICFQTLHCDPHQVLVILNIYSEVFSVFYDFILGGLIFFPFLVKILISLLLSLLLLQL